MPTSSPAYDALVRMAVALSGEDPSAALDEAISALSALGIVPSAEGTGEPWLVVTHAGQSLSLSLTGPPPSPEIGALVEHQLRPGLLRVAEHEERRRVRERLEMLSGASFEGIFVHVDGVVIDANQRVSEMLGLTPAEMLGPATLPRCVAPEDLPTVLKLMEQRFEGSYVITAVRKDGSRFRAELQSKQGKLGDRPVRVVAVRDVTERERTHALLLESEARLRGLVTATFDFFVMSRGGRVVEVGGRIEETVGYRPEEVIGRGLLDFVAPSARSYARQVIEEQRVGGYESLLRAKNGELVPVEIVAVTSTLDGEPVRIGAMRDLRERRRLEREREKLAEQLEQRQRLDSLGVLAGGIAHDFNNLLVGVIGNAELLAESLTDPEHRECADSILAAGQRAASLTGQMLAYAGRRHLGPNEPLDVGGLFRELRSLLDATLSKKASVEISVEPGSVILGSRVTLTQVLMNLLTNASDALQGRTGGIDVTVSRVRDPGPRWSAALGSRVGPGNWISIEVTDTGTGMDPLTRRRVFEPFFSTKREGRGLGLAASLGIVSAHGGAIVVESEVSRGSTFAVLLPAAEQAPEASAVTAPVARAPGIRVLVIDDEALVRSQVRRLLEHNGFVVVEAHNGEAGLAALAAATFDVLLIDVTMPDLDGAEVVRRIRASGSMVPIVLSSGYVGAAVGKGLEPTAIQGFLGKPYRMADLIQTIERALVPS